MQQKYLQLLKFIANRETTTTKGVVQWTFKGLNDEDVEHLMEKEYITVSLGEGYTGGMKYLHLTPKAQEFISSYCEVCECMPCDCDWGH